MSKDYTSVITPGTPVGIGNVVKMEYEIGYGPLDTGVTTKLAWTESFKQGVSLSNISWAFVNTGSMKGKETTGKISFTLHDIAGLLFEKYMHLKKGIEYIYFKGPKSDGKLWSGLESLYMVDPDGCSLEFSATQGFTYTIAGISAVTVARSKEVTSADEYGVSGVLQGTNQTFKETVTKDLVQMWNKKATESGKPLAQIVLVMDYDKEKNAEYGERKPVSVDKKQGGENDKTFSFTVKKDDTIHDAVTRLWSEIFQDNDDAKCPNDNNKNVRCRVDFQSWSKEGKVTCQILFTDNTIEKSLNNQLWICVGDDDNCGGAEYRGELASINLNDIANKFLIHRSNKETESAGTAPAGSEKKTDAPTPCKYPEERKHANDHGNTDQKKMDWKANGFLSTSEGGKDSGYWGQMYKLLQDNNATPLEIEINMPYTSDFTPSSHTGKLKPGMDGVVSTIDLTQGAYLSFFWYNSTDCDKLVESPVISGHYRISEVNHQIGLGGNQTVVKLSHLQLGD